MGTLMRPARRFGQALTFGGRVPAAVGAIITITVVATFVGVIGHRNGLPLLAATVFAPELVWRGEVWRLVTWIFVFPDPVPLPLVFACLMLYWFGRDLAFHWGERRFVLVYLGIAAAAAAVTCLLSLAWPSLGGVLYAGAWPVVDALVVAWALLFPDRQIFIWFALPVSSRALLYVTIGGTLLYAVWGGLAGFGSYVPHLLGEGMMLLYVQGRPGRLLRKVRWRPFERLRRSRDRKRFKVIDADHDPDRPDRPRWLN